MKKTRDFSFRGMEIHSRRCLQLKHIDWAVEFCEKYALNALILHNNDLSDMLAYPKKILDPLYAMEQHSVRRLFITNDTLYIKNAARRCREKGIDFYLETKEIYYGDGILQACPEVLNADGSVCPSHPFWFTFVEEKIREVIEDVVPDMAGMIVSIGTRESMVSFIKNQCNCARCQEMGLAGWYEKLIEALYKPLHEYGKKLVIRDFSFQRFNAEMLMSAVDKAGSDIVMALKYVPQDYFPNWPDNPRIGDKQGHQQFIEYDTWGQFFGLGYFPISIVEDFTKRMRFAKEQGADGVWFRTDWEGLQEASIYNSMNQLNLIGGAMLASNLDTNIDDIYKSWLDEGLKNPELAGSYEQPYRTPTAPDARERLQKFMQKSWEVMEKALYMRGGNLYHFSSRFGDSIYWIRRTMFRMSMLDSYSPGAFEKVAPTDENIREIAKEKAEALVGVKQLREILSPDTLGLPDDFTAYLNRMLDNYELYVEGWEIHAMCYMLVTKADETHAEADIEKAEKQVDALCEYSKQLDAHLYEMLSFLPHYMETLLAPDKALLFVDDCRKAIEDIRLGNPIGLQEIPGKYSYGNADKLTWADPNNFKKD